MTIVNVGVSYRVAPAGVLEKLAVPSPQQGGVLARLHAAPSIDEVVVLSTCNRIEVYAASDGPAERVTGAVVGVMAAHGQIPADDVLRTARVRTGDRRDGGERRGDRAVEGRPFVRLAIRHIGSRFTH